MQYFRTFRANDDCKVRSIFEIHCKLGLSGVTKSSIDLKVFAFESIAENVYHWVPNGQNISEISL